MDEVFPEPTLKPDSPQDKARMQEWIKASDEALYQSVSSLCFSMVFRERLNAMGEDALEAHFSKQTDLERTHRQRSCVVNGTRSPYVLRAVVAWEKMLKEIEVTLENGGPWIMGKEFSLVEIALGPFVTRLHDLHILSIWMEDCPFVAEWWGRVQQRPSFLEADVSAGADLADAYREAGNKYYSDIEELRAWYLKDPIECGRAYQTV